MRILDLFEDGRIVKGVNTTPDVGTGEITRQAAKFGFSVSKDGVPTKTLGESAKAVALRKLHGDKVDLMSHNPEAVDRYAERFKSDPSSIEPIKIRVMTLHPILHKGPWIRGETHYEILDGHHRYLAAKKAGLTKIPAIIVK